MIFFINKVNIQLAGLRLSLTPLNDEMMDKSINIYVFFFLKFKGDVRAMIGLGKIPRDY